MNHTLVFLSEEAPVFIWHYNTRSTQKSPVRQQNAWFDTKKPGSTQKCPVRHKNALPIMHQWTLPLSNIPRPFREKYFFPILFQYFVFNNPIEKWKWNYIDMNSKLVNSISLWKLKCNHSFPDNIAEAGRLRLPDGTYGSLRQGIAAAHSEVGRRRLCQIKNAHATAWWREADAGWLPACRCRPGALRQHRLCRITCCTRSDVR